MKKVSKKVVNKVKALKEETVPEHLKTGAAPELHPEFDPDMPLHKQRHLIR